MLNIDAMRKTLLIFFGSLIFLALTVPENHTEAEDAYYYARMVESGRGAELYHRHHLLYLPVGRALLTGARAAGYAGRALPVLIAWSVVAGAVTVTSLAILLGRRGGWAAVGLLGSYGFWRYAGTAEIYVPVMALMTGALLCAVRSDRRVGWAAGAVILSAAALLLHLAALPAVLGGIPALYLARRQGRRALAHGVAVAALTAGMYGWVAHAWGTVVFTDTEALRHGLTSMRAWAGAGVSFGHTVLSGNFIFALPWAAERIQALLPYHMLHEEVFMGAHAPGWVRGVAPLTALAAAVALAGAGVVAVRSAWRFRCVADPGWSIDLGAAIWLAGSCAMALLFEPANPEMWLPALPALWLCAGRLWLRAGAGPTGLWRRVPLVAVALLLLHNAAGGLALVWSGDGDYGRRKMAAVIGRAGPDDWILTADSHSTITYLQYHTPARVVDGRFVGLKEWRALMESRPPARVWVLGEMLHPPPAVRNRAAAAEDRRRELATLLAPDLTPAHEDEWSTVYLWRAERRTEDGEVRSFR
jgi:hypothetical protein